MASSLNASTSGGGGVIVTSDATGNLNIQSGGSTVVAVTAAGATVTGTLAATGAVTASTTLAVTGASTFTGTGKFATTIGVGNATPAASGSGITFPATQSASSDANTLDDYEEGDWTPTWIAASGTITANSNTSGKYVKIGKVVYIWGYISYQSNASASGAVSVGGLPFTSGSGFGQSGNRSGGVYTIGNAFFTSNSPNIGNIATGTVQISPAITTATSTTNLTFADLSTAFANASQFVFAGQYNI